MANCFRSTLLGLGGIFPSKAKLERVIKQVQEQKRNLRRRNLNGSKYRWKAILPLSRLPIQRRTGLASCPVEPIIPVSSPVPILAHPTTILIGILPYCLPRRSRRHSGASSCAFFHTICPCVENVSRLHIWRLVTEFATASKAINAAARSCAPWKQHS